MEVIECPVVERPSLVVYPHALVGEGRVIEVAAFLPSETLGDYVRRVGVAVPNGRIRVWHNGCRVPDALWKRLIPRTGDQIVIRQLPAGGDAGKVIRTVALVALALSAPYLAAALNTSLGLGFAAGSFGLGALTAGIMIGGGMLITALLPPLKASTAAIASSATASNQAYTLSGGQNQARLWQPMMLIFGKMKVTGDLAANYYTEYVGDTQYLNQVFHFGLQNGGGTFSNFKIGDTPIENYQGVQLQAADQNGNLSLFPVNVDTIPGFTLTSGVVNSRTTSQNTTHISIELAAQLFYVNDSGGMDARSVDLRVQYRPVGGAWVDIGLLQDAIYATHYWSLEYLPTNDWAGGLQAAYGSTNPSDHYEGEPGLIQEGDDYNPPLYGWWRWEPHPFQLGQPWQGVAPDPLLGYSSTPGVRMTGAKQEPTRQTIGFDVPVGQYEVRAWKVTGDISSSRESNQVAVNQIRCYQTDTTDYTGQLRIAMRIQATSQLNGAVDQFNGMFSMGCPTWNGSAWVWAETSNPAWWFLWYARGKRNAAGNRIYGACLPDSRIDIEGIKAWAAWCDSKRLTFNYKLSDSKSVHDVLVIIARAGRASYSWQTGKLGVVWDAADLPVVAMIGPYNIKAGSFKVVYNADQTADQVVVNFVNAAKGYVADSVRANVPNVGTTNSVVTLDFEGCDNADMAGREANLIAADQEYHYRKVQWEMDLEGLIATRGDVVEMSHDLTVWSYSGRCLSLTADTVKLDKPVPTGGTGWAMLRDPENSMALVAISADTGGTGETDTLTILTDFPAGFHLPSEAGYDDLPPFDWAWQFDPLATPGRRIKIIDVQAGSDMGLKFTGQDDSSDYYACETNLYAHTPPRDGALLAGVVFGLSFTESLVNVAADISNVTISWTTSNGGRVQVAPSINGVAQQSALTTDRSISIQAKTGDTITVTVTPKPTTGGSGTPMTRSYTVQGLLVPLPTLTGLTSVFRDGLTTLVWDPVTDIRQPDYEIRLGTSFENGRKIALTRNLDSIAVGNGLYWVAAHFTGSGRTVYGAPDSLLISGATLVRNVILTQDEAPDWTGTVSDGAYVSDGKLTLAPQGDFLAIEDIFAEQDILWYGGPASSGIYTNAEADQVDIGYVTPVRVGFDIEVRTWNATDDILSAPDIFAIADILNGSDLQKVTVTPQIRYAQTEGDWSDWVNFVPGLINARYFDVRLLLATSDPLIIPYITKFEWSVDVDDLIQQETGVTVPDTGLTVTYDKAFHTDAASPQVTQLDAVNGDIVKVTDADRAGFTLQIFNGSTAKAGTVNWITQSY